MDEERQIRFLVSLALFAASLLIGDLLASVRFLDRTPIEDHVVVIGATPWASLSYGES
jgi:hypothetical protein